MQGTILTLIPASPGSALGQAPESRENKTIWTSVPARLSGFAGVTASRAFCKTVTRGAETWEIPCL